jgi:predicted dehydrogenase
MSSITRRDFLKSSLATGAALALPACVAKTSPNSKIIGANGDIRVAVAGINGKGKSHIDMVRQIPGVRLVALCDPDERVLKMRAEELSKAGVQVETAKDIREILDRKDVDVVTTASPNHWHSLMTVWACQAGKDMYVEKPLSHDIWEGRKAVEAARKYKRIVQVGTQSRSDSGNKEVFAYLQAGNLGKIQYAHGLCIKGRGSIGKVDGPQPVPPFIDYDLWCGPAQMEPLMRRNLHYDWHWVWPTGNGDIGNQGIHEMDLCRWALGQDKIAPRAMSVGGRFVWNDDGVTPNTQIAILDYKPAPLIFEVQNMQAGKDKNAENHYRGVRIGLVVQCENGYFAGKDGGWVYDNKGEKIQQFKGGGAGSHMDNFIQAVKSRKETDLNADVLQGHLSAVLFHEANISYRLGKTMSQGEIRERMAGQTEALDTLARIEEHLVANGVDVKASPITVGPWLQMDVETERFVGEFAEEANKLVSREYRKPFEIREKV